MNIKIKHALGNVLDEDGKILTYGHGIPAGDTVRALKQLFHYLLSHPEEWEEVEEDYFDADGWHWSASVH